MGYLLKSVTVMSNPMMKGATFTEVATSVDKSPIPPSTFAIPAGYTARTKP